MTLNSTMRRLRGERALLAASGLAAILASLCCPGAALLLALGASSAWVSTLSVFDPYRPLLIGVAAATLLLALRRASVRRPACDRNMVGTASDLTRSHAAAPMLESTLTCPVCGHASTLIMPTDACQWHHECGQCHAVIRPKPGDCCVFCSYGTVACPSIQRARATDAATSP